MIGENVNLFNFGLRATSKGAFLKKGRKENKQTKNNKKKKQRRKGKGKETITRYQIKKGFL